MFTLVYFIIITKRQLIITDSQSNSIFLVYFVERIRVHEPRAKLSCVFMLKTKLKRVNKEGGWFFTLPQLVQKTKKTLCLVVFCNNVKNTSSVRPTGRSSAFNLNDCSRKWRVVQLQRPVYFLPSKGLSHEMDWFFVDLHRYWVDLDRKKWGLRQV